MSEEKKNDILKQENELDEAELDNVSGGLKVCMWGIGINTGSLKDKNAKDS